LTFTIFNPSAFYRSGRHSEVSGIPSYQSPGLWDFAVVLIYPNNEICGDLLTFILFFVAYFGKRFNILLVVV
jgi:hypothetical protein